MNSSVDKESERDELIEALLDEALRDYAGTVTPEVLEEMRHALGDLMAVHPDGQAILRQLQPDPQVDASGDVALDGADSEKERARKARG